MTDRTEEPAGRPDGTPAGVPAEGNADAPAGVDSGRRRFLAVAGLGGAGAVAVSAASRVSAEVAESPEEQIKGRYERTPHVERFYFLNRL